MCTLSSDKQKHYAEQDKKILELFKIDPKEAFMLMFELYHKPLCLYVVQLTDSFSMAEDLVQDLFLVLWEKKAYLNISVNLRGYLFQAARNNTYLLLRKNNLVSIEEIFGAEIPVTDDLFDEELLREKELALMVEIQKLPKQELAVVTSVILENKKYKEAAQELGISVNTLKTYMSRALKRLRNHGYFIYMLIV